MTFLSADPNIEVLQICSHLLDAYHQVTMLYKEPSSCVLKKTKGKSSGNYSKHLGNKSKEPIEASCMVQYARKYNPKNDRRKWREIKELSFNYKCISQQPAHVQLIITIN